MEPCDDPILIELAVKCFNEEDISPLIRHFVDMKYEKYYLMKLLRKSVPISRKAFGCMNILIDIKEGMSDGDCKIISDRYFDCRKEYFEIMKNIVEGK